MDIEVTRVDRLIVYVTLVRQKHHADLAVNEEGKVFSYITTRAN